MAEQDEESTPEEKEQQASTMNKQPEQAVYTITSSGPGNLHDTASLFDWKVFYEQVLQTASSNYAGNRNLDWGTIKLNLATMRQVGVDDEKNFLEERIAMGERLLAKDYQPYLV
jgi:hypothetical protein